MELEQIRPNKPRFGLVVAVFAIGLIVFLLLALFVLDYHGWRTHSRRLPPTAHLILPSRVAV